MRFIHTADWQIGMPFVCAPDKGNDLRRARIDVIKQIIALAESESAEFILAAGDLFDKNMLSPMIVEEVARIVSNSKVPIYLLPGNHDPLTLDSPYVRTPELFKDSAVVLREAAPLKLANCTLYPCPARSKKSGLDPTSWIPPKSEDEGIRIGIAHGSVNTPGESDYPIAPNAASAKELDYLALGHWHGVKKIDERTWYCGAPESTSFGQPNAGKVLQVDITAPGAVPKVREIEVARFKWKDVSKEIHTEEEVQALIAELKSLATPQTLLRLKLTGSLPQGVVDQIESFNCEPCFHFAKVIDVAVETGEWKYRNSLLKMMAARLCAEAESGDESTSKIARRALSKLNFLVKHAGFRGEGNNNAH